MASEITAYNIFYEQIGKSGYNLQDDTIKLALLKDTYTLDVTHEVLADVIGSPSNELPQIDSPDNGYTAGGKAVTGKTLTMVTSPDKKVTFDAADIEWTSLTGTFKWGILYKEGSAGTLTNPLIACILFDNTPGSITISDVNFIVIWPTDGIIEWGPV